jgi:hypothetical protein
MSVHETRQALDRLLAEHAALQHHARAAIQLQARLRALFNSAGGPLGLPRVGGAFGEGGRRFWPADASAVGSTARSHAAGCSLRGCAWLANGIRRQSCGAGGCAQRPLRKMAIAQALGVGGIPSTVHLEHPQIYSLKGDQPNVEAPALPS